MQKLRVIHFKQLWEEGKTVRELSDFFKISQSTVKRYRRSLGLEKRGKEVVKVFKKDMELILVEERIENQYIGWKETNKYWVDDTNFVWKSEQFISPRLPKFIIEVTKKPSL